MGVDVFMFRSFSNSVNCVSDLLLRDEDDDIEEGVEEDEEELSQVFEFLFFIFNFLLMTRNSFTILVLIFMV